MRNAEIARKTLETDISLRLALDGTGKSQIQTGIGFFDHMLTLFAKHGRFDLELTCNGDIWVDGHHSVEDIGLALGEALRQALGEKRGIVRYGQMLLPMDEALILCAVDLSGRSYLGFDAKFPSQKVGVFDTELVHEFMQAFCQKGQFTLHIKALAGENTHHLIEGMFKALGRALRQAVAIDPDAAEEIPSTKGVLA